MTISEVSDVLDQMKNLKVDEMEVLDQLKYMAAATQLAEAVKPLVIKYLNDVPEKSTFLFKM